MYICCSFETLKPVVKSKSCDTDSNSASAGYKLRDLKKFVPQLLHL